MQQIVVPVRAKLEGFSTTAVGVMGATYFGGFAVVLVATLAGRVKKPLPKSRARSPGFLRPSVGAFLI